MCIQLLQNTYTRLKGHFVFIVGFEAKQKNDQMIQNFGCCFKSTRLLRAVQIHLLPLSRGNVKGSAENKMNLIKNYIQKINQHNISLSENITNTSDFTGMRCQ